jgi:hypothetical protein
MNDLIIESTDRTPAIRFIRHTLSFEIEGESYPEDVAAFYGQVIPAIEQWQQSEATSLKVCINLIYINSSSMKALYRIFDVLDQGRASGKQVSVIWGYVEDDDVMQELGEDFRDRFPELAVDVKVTD